MTGRLEGGLERWVPGLRTLREYQRSWLASDLVAGLVLTALLVPVGMGYAQAAGLPPITGLYATIVPLVAYAIFGPSRVMVLGPDSSLAAVIAAVILPLGGDDPETAVALAGALAVTTVLSQSLAAQRNETVDPDQELRALGANLAAGLFQPFAISSSASRTPVALSAGARSQLTPLVGAVTIALLLVFAPGLLRDLPLPMLAAIVITAAIGLIDVAAVRRLYRVRRSEFVLWLAAFGGGGPARGADGDLHGHPAVAGRLHPSGLAAPRRRARPEDELKGYHDIDRHPSARQVPGLLLYRFDAPLFFANAAWFRRRVKGLVAEAAHPVRWVVATAEPITDVDTTAANILDQLLRELRQQRVTLAFAELKGPVKDRLGRYGLYDAIGPDHFFPTIGTAVDAYVTATGTTWVDWEERSAPGPDTPG
jgi:MFS superfamily sulfate permease-like transporter